MDIAKLPCSSCLPPPPLPPSTNTHAQLPGPLNFKRAPVQMIKPTVYLNTVCKHRELCLLQPGLSSLRLRAFARMLLGEYLVPPNWLHPGNQTLKHAPELADFQVWERIRSPTADTHPTKAQVKLYLTPQLQQSALTRATKRCALTLAVPA